MPAGCQKSVDDKNRNAKTKNLKENSMKIGAKQLACSAAIRPSEPLGSPMLTFDLTAEIERLRKGMLGRGAELKTLVKHADFRIVLIVLNPEARLHSASPRTQVAGRIFVQTVACHIRMHVRSQLFDLPAGHSLALEHVLPHNVEPSEESAFLLTIVCLTTLKKAERHECSALQRRIKSHG
jgi:hypothetical protein